MKKYTKLSLTYHQMSRVMRKPTFCIWENKDADQLRGNPEADQRLCFRYTVQSLYFLNLKFPASSHLLWLYSRFVSDLVENPEDRFSCDTAQIRSLSFLLHTHRTRITKLLRQSTNHSPNQTALVLFEQAF